MFGSKDTYKCKNATTGKRSVEKFARMDGGRPEENLSRGWSFFEWANALVLIRPGVIWSSRRPGLAEVPALTTQFGWTQLRLVSGNGRER